MPATRTDWLGRGSARHRAWQGLLSQVTEGSPALLRSTAHPLRRSVFFHSKAADKAWALSLRPFLPVCLRQNHPRIKGTGPAGLSSTLVAQGLAQDTKGRAQGVGRLGGQEATGQAPLKQPQESPCWGVRCPKQWSSPGERSPAQTPVPRRTVRAYLAQSRASFCFSASSFAGLIQGLSGFPFL